MSREAPALDRQDRDVGIGTNWNREQLDYIEQMQTCIDRAITAQWSDNEQEADRARHEAREHGIAVVCFGPPGRGKTTAMFNVIEYAIDKGGKVLLTLPTGQLSAHMKQTGAEQLTSTHVLLRFFFRGRAHWRMSFFSHVLLGTH